MGIWVACVISRYSTKFADAANNLVFHPGWLSKYTKSNWLIFKIKAGEVLQIPRLFCASNTHKEISDHMEELLFWSNQVLRYLNLKRVSVGLTEEEQRLLEGLQGAIEQAMRQ